MKTCWAFRVVAASVWLAVVAGASAQERIELIAQELGTLQSVLVDVEVGPNGLGAIRHVTRIDMPIPLGNGNLSSGNQRDPNTIAAVGGRHLIWPSLVAGRVGPVAFDRLTRQVLDFTSLLPGRATQFVADPIRPRFFAGGEDTAFRAAIWLVDIPTMSVRRVFAGGIPGGLNFDYAADVDRLFVISDGFISVIDVETSALLHHFRTTVLPPIEVNRAGTHLYQSSNVGVYRLDPTDGHVVAFAGMYALSPYFDEARHVLLAPWPNEGRLAVLDADTLTTIALLQVSPVPATTPSVIERFDVAPSIGPTGVYVLRVERLQGQDELCSRIALDSLDRTGRLSTTIDLVDITRLRGRPHCGARAIVLRPPEAPAGLSAQVEGRRVTLTWQAPGLVNGYVVEAGAAPGQTFLRHPTGPVEAVSFDEVPAGSYYVRIRALNDVGLGQASTDVLIVVP